MKRFNPFTMYYIPDAFFRVASILNIIYVWAKSVQRERISESKLWLCRKVNFFYCLFLRIIIWEYILQISNPNKVDWDMVVEREKSLPKTTWNCSFKCVFSTNYTFATGVQNYSETAKPIFYYRNLATLFNT